MPLSRHPHRFQIAAFKAAETSLGLGSRLTAKGLVAAAFGERAPIDPMRPDLEVQSVPLSLEQFRRNADLLRKLASRFPKTADDAAWLVAMSQAITIGFTLGPHAKEAAKQGALSYAAGVGEGRWARDALVPWIDAMKTKSDLAADRAELARLFADLLSQPQP